MAAIVYATVDDLTATPWLDGDPPANADRLLALASFVVAQACFRNPYNDTPDASAVEPLRDATCAQAASWVALGIDPAALGIDTAPVKKSSLLGADVERDTTGQAQARATAARELAPQACAILTAAGLIYLPLPVWTAPTDQLFTYGLDQPVSMSPLSDWPLM